jgi:GTPase involved in cell partitioning and DNA repair
MGRDVALQVPIGTVIYEMSKKPVKHDPNEFVRRPHEIHEWQISDFKTRCATGSACRRVCKELHEIEESERQIYLDLNKWTGHPILLIHGGKVGLGKMIFAAPDIGMPRFGTKGEPGTEVNLLHELKLIADVAIIGRPNARNRPSSPDLGREKHACRTLGLHHA